VLGRLVQEEERRDLVLQRDVRRFAEQHAVAVQIADDQAVGARRTYVEGSVFGQIRAVSASLKRQEVERHGADVVLDGEDGLRFILRSRRWVQLSGEGTGLQIDRPA